MIYCECPSTYDLYMSSVRRLFVAGGITDCHDWQKVLVSSLEDSNLIIYNPRRQNFNVKDTNIVNEQIKWEYTQLRKSDIICFWFAEETLCPITLFELGFWLSRGKDIVIGVHPDYKRKIDIEIQTRLLDPSIKIYYSIEDVTKKILTLL